MSHHAWSSWRTSQVIIPQQSKAGVSVLVGRSSLSIEKEHSRSTTWSLRKIRLTGPLKVHELMVPYQSAYESWDGPPPTFAPEVHAELISHHRCSNPRF